MKRLFIFLMLLLAVTSGRSQEGPSSCHCPGMTKAGKGSLYFGMGFHRIFYTRSTIHFRDDRTANYDFTLHKLRAVDDNDLNLGQGIDAPQYSFRFGYYFNNKKDLGIEFNFDHAKYIVVQNQNVHVTGQINGVKMDKDTILYSSFVEYEHTDGANYYMINFLKRKNLLHSNNEKHWLSAVIKPGLGIVLPRSDTRVLGLHRDDRYHVAGYVIGLDAGLRYDFFRHFFVETSLKGAFANYKNVLLYGDGRARQKWWSLQTIAVAGFQFSL